MAAPQYRPSKYLILLLVLIIGLSVWAFLPGEGNSRTPRLGLDLRGGTQVILDPQPINEGAEITEEQLEQSVEIIRQRVNGVGVAEADISIQGSGDNAVIVVSVPGVTQDRIVELVGRTALLDFRAVENILDPAPVSADEASADGENGNNNKKTKTRTRTRTTTTEIVQAISRVPRRRRRMTVQPPKAIRKAPIARVLRSCSQKITMPSSSRKS